MWKPWFRLVWLSCLMACGHFELNESRGQGSQSERGTATFPSDLLDLANWKLQLPTGNPGRVDEVRDLTNFEAPPYFGLNAEGDGVVFAAPVNGVTTSGSQFPRSELREMNGQSRAAWSTSSGMHTMVIDEAITHLPAVRSEIIAGQIHDATTYVLGIRIKKNSDGILHLIVQTSRNHVPPGVSTTLGELNGNYVLGTRFIVSISVLGDHFQVSYDDGLNPPMTVDWDHGTTSAYFKAGAYTQSNLDVPGEDPNDYGEVVVYGLSVVHES